MQAAEKNPQPVSLDKQITLILQNRDIETNASTGAVCIGKELASFTEDGTSIFTVAPITIPSSAKGVTYSGSMTYGIQLVD